jgi:hypothetical protein
MTDRDKLVLLAYLFDSNDAPGPNVPAPSRTEARIAGALIGFGYLTVKDAGGGHFCYALADGVKEDFFHIRDSEGGQELIDAMRECR